MYCFPRDGKVSPLSLGEKMYGPAASATTPPAANGWNLFVAGPKPVSSADGDSVLRSSGSAEVPLLRISIGGEEEVHSKGKQFPWRPMLAPFCHNPQRRGTSAVLFTYACSQLTTGDSRRVSPPTGKAPLTSHPRRRPLSLRLLEVDGVGPDATRPPDQCGPRVSLLRA